MCGIELSERFFHDVIDPILQAQYQPWLPFFAAGLIGSGSEVLGFDDDLSQDHNFSPRVQLFVAQPSLEPLIDTLRHTIVAAAPTHYLGFALQQDQWLSFIEVAPLDAFFLNYLHLADWPRTPQDWLKLDEQKLVELTNGKVFFDPQGRLQQRRALLHFYPDDVRIFLLYQGFVRLSEVGAIERTIQRGDRIATELYRAFFVYFAIKVFHLYCRRYCPYHKWMGRHLQTLGDNGVKLHQLLETMMTTVDLSATRTGVIDILHFLSEPILQELGVDLTNIPPSHERLHLIDFDWDCVLTALKRVLPDELQRLSPVITPKNMWGLLFDMEGLGSDHRATLQANLDFLRQE